NSLNEVTTSPMGNDSAPHTEETCLCKWVVAAMGMTGLDTRLPVSQHTLVDTGLMHWHGVAQVMSANPARIYRHTIQGQLTETGGLLEGALANIAVYDPAHRFVVNAINHTTRST